MKVSELSGGDLALAVAKACGHQLSYGLGWMGDRAIEVYDASGASLGVILDGDEGTYAPHRDWAQGGAIIQRDGIELSVSCYRGELDATPIGWGARKEVKFEGDDGCADSRSYWGQGETPLIAAMRAFVASKYGDEVPDET